MRRYTRFACLTTPFLFNLLGGVIPLYDLRDFWWEWPSYNVVQRYPRKVKPLSRVHARHRRQTIDRETDIETTDRRICHAISQT